MCNDDPLASPTGDLQAPMPLSQLPPSCGYTLRSTQQDMVLVAPYKGCYVFLEVGYDFLSSL